MGHVVEETLNPQWDTRVEFFTTDYTQVCFFVFFVSMKSIFFYINVFKNFIFVLKFVHFVQPTTNRFLLFTMSDLCVLFFFYEIPLFIVITLNIRLS